jgi:ATP-dependent Clp protease adaptor protein ClpS
MPTALTSRIKMTKFQGQEQDSITKLRGAPKYNVIMLNDNLTPIDFVIQILMSIYNKTSDQATEITMNIHENGRGIAGTYSYEVAEQKALETINEARAAGYPLDVVIDEAE